MDKYTMFLNSVGKVLTKSSSKGDFAGMDEHFEEWRASKTRKPFGAWLNGKYPEEFTRRIPNIDKQLKGA
jgi:hypothetical protein